MANKELVYKVATEVLGDGIFNSFTEDYATRLLVQKAIYVFQETTKKDLFGYSWYVAGPYSPKVTDIAYNYIIPNIETKKTEWSNLEFSEQGITRLEKVKSFLEITKSDLDKIGLQKMDFYELMASMLYLYDNYHTDKSGTLEKLKAAKGEKFGNAAIETIVNNYWQRIGAFAA